MNGSDEVGILDLYKADVYVQKLSGVFINRLHLGNPFLVNDISSIVEYR
jgi:hypothetical protein